MQKKNHEESIGDSLDSERTWFFIYLAHCYVKLDIVSYFVWVYHNNAYYCSIIMYLFSFIIKLSILYKYRLRFCFRFCPLCSALVYPSAKREENGNDFTGIVHGSVKWRAHAFETLSQVHYLLTTNTATTTLLNRTQRSFGFLTATATIHNVVVSALPKGTKKSDRWRRSKHRFFIVVES